MIPRDALGASGASLCDEMILVSLSQPFRMLVVSDLQGCLVKIHGVLLWPAGPSSCTSSHGRMLIGLGTGPIIGVHAKPISCDRLH